MRLAIKHDHLYAVSSMNPCFLNSISIDHQSPSPLISESQTIPSVQVIDKFCVGMFVNDDPAIFFYTAFPSYAHFRTCFNYLGNAVNHLIYPDSSADENEISRVKTQRILSPQNDFFDNLSSLMWSHGTGFSLLFSNFTVYSLAHF